MKHEIKVGTVEVVASNEVGFGWLAVGGAYTGEDSVPMGMLEDASYDEQRDAQGYYPE